MRWNTAQLVLLALAGPLGSASSLSTPQSLEGELTWVARNEAVTSERAIQNLTTSLISHESDT
eukprot:6890493-Pyramimonas_sp.AAC.1